MAEEIGLPKLSLGQVVKVCEVAEVAARNFILSKVSKQKIVDLDITVDVITSKPLIVNVDVDVALSPLAGEVDVDRLVDQAVDRALQAAEGKLREFSVCKSKV